jgi:hypothetical protein
MSSANDGTKVFSDPRLSSVLAHRLSQSPCWEGLRRCDVQLNEDAPRLRTELLNHPCRPLPKSLSITLKNECPREITEAAGEEPM